jgi:hypothetical protein
MTKEKVMRVFSLNELMFLTRGQLLDLHAQIVALLATLAEGSPDYQSALLNLRNIRRVLAQPRWAPS